MILLKRTKADHAEPKAKKLIFPEDDDLEKHSESVQKRIKKLKFEFHEERRRKEEAEREREAAVQYAQNAKSEADKLRKNLSEGEGRPNHTGKST